METFDLSTISGIVLASGDRIIYKVIYLDSLHVSLLLLSIAMQPMHIFIAVLLPRVHCYCLPRSAVIIKFMHQGWGST